MRQQRKLVALGFALLTIAGSRQALANQNVSPQAAAAAEIVPQTLYESAPIGWHSLCFSPDGRTLASGSTDRTIKVWPLQPK